MNAFFRKAALVALPCVYSACVRVTPSLTEQPPPVLLSAEPHVFVEMGASHGESVTGSAVRDGHIGELACSSSVLWLLLVTIHPGLSPLGTQPAGRKPDHAWMSALSVAPREEPPCPRAGPAALLDGRVLLQGSRHTSQQLLFLSHPVGRPRGGRPRPPPAQAPMG